MNWSFSVSLGMGHSGCDQLTLLTHFKPWHFFLTNVGFLSWIWKDILEKIEQRLPPNCHHSLIYFISCQYFCSPYIIDFLSFPGSKYGEHQPKRARFTTVTSANIVCGWGSHMAGGNSTIEPVLNKVHRSFIVQFNYNGRVNSCWCSWRFKNHQPWLRCFGVGCPSLSLAVGTALSMCWWHPLKDVIQYVKIIL